MKLLGFPTDTDSLEVFWNRFGRGERSTILEVNDLLNTAFWWGLDPLQFCRELFMNRFSWFYLRYPVGELGSSSLDGAQYIFEVPEPRFSEGLEEPGRNLVIVKSVAFLTGPKLACIDFGDAKMSSSEWPDSFVDDLAVIKKAGFIFTDQGVLATYSNVTWSDQPKSPPRKRKLRMPAIKA